MSEKLRSLIFALSGASEEEIHEHFGAVMQQLTAEHEGYTLETANGVYVKEGYLVPDAFKDIIAGHYMGQFQQLDFMPKVEAAKVS